MNHIDKAITLPIGKSVQGHFYILNLHITTSNGGTFVLK